MKTFSSLPDSNIFSGAAAIEPLVPVHCPRLNFLVYNTILSVAIEIVVVMVTENNFLNENLIIQCFTEKL